MRFPEELKKIISKEILSQLIKVEEKENAVKLEQPVNIQSDKTKVSLLGKLKQKNEQAKQIEREINKKDITKITKKDI